jgi:hypothetical protein
MLTNVALGPEPFVGHGVAEAISPAPGDAVSFSHERHRLCAARLEEASLQRLVSMADILDVLDVNSIGLDRTTPARYRAFVPP